MIQIAQLQTFIYSLITGPVWHVRSVEQEISQVSNSFKPQKGRS